MRLGGGAAAGIAGEYALGSLLHLGLATAVGAPPTPGEPPG